MSDEFDHMSDEEIDADDLINSDIEDNDDDEINQKNISDGEDDDDEDNDDDEDDEIRLITARKKLHMITSNSGLNQDKCIIVKPENRITSNIITLFEYTSVIGTRATHIANGATIYVDIGNLTDARDIAKKEIDENKCPLSVVRKLGTSDKVEIWEVNELIKPNI